MLPASTFMHTIPISHVGHKQMAPGIPPVEASELPDASCMNVQACCACLLYLKFHQTTCSNSAVFIDPEIKWQAERPRLCMQNKYCLFRRRVRTIIRLVLPYDLITLYKTFKNVLCFCPSSPSLCPHSAPYIRCL